MRASREELDAFVETLVPVHNISDEERSLIVDFFELQKTDVLELQKPRLNYTICLAGRACKQLQNILTVDDGCTFLDDRNVGTIRRLIYRDVS